MAKQETSQPYPQQLSLNLSQSKPASVSASKQSAHVTSFVDAATLSVRQQALARVRSAKIFEPPKPRSK